MNNCPMCGAPKPNEEWDWSKHSIPGVAKSAPVLGLPVAYEEAMSLYDLLRSVQYSRRSQYQAYAGLAGRIAERLSEVIDQYERGGAKTP